MMKVLPRYAEICRDMPHFKRVAGIPWTNPERRKGEPPIYFRYTLDIQSWYKRCKKSDLIAHIQYVVKLFFFMTCRYYLKGR
jgi:hypothetical protein